MTDDLVATVSQQLQSILRSPLSKIHLLFDSALSTLFIQGEIGRFYEFQMIQFSLARLVPAGVRLSYDLSIDYKGVNGRIKS